jgi:hypothetical protein
VGRNLNARAWPVTSTRLVVCVMRLDPLIPLLDQSFLTLRQIFVGSPRFSDLPAYQIIMAVVEDRRPPRPCQEFGTDNGLNDAMWELIEQCWKMIPEHRPTASDVVRELLSQSCARERGVPPCDWDEAFMSRLRSTLADDPFVLPSFSEDDSGGSFYLYSIS